MRARWWWTAGLGLAASPVFSQAPTLAEPAPLARWAAPAVAAAPSSTPAGVNLPAAAGYTAPSSYPTTPSYAGAPSYTAVTNSPAPTAAATPVGNSTSQVYAVAQNTTAAPSYPASLGDSAASSYPAVSSYPAAPSYAGSPNVTSAGTTPSASYSAPTYAATPYAGSGYAAPAGYVAAMAARDPQPRSELGQGQGEILLTHGVHSVSTIAPPSAAAEAVSSRRPGWENATLGAAPTPSDARPPALPPETGELNPPTTRPASAEDGPTESTANAPASVAPKTAYARERWLDGQGWERPHPVAGGAPLDPSAPRVASNRADAVSYRPTAAQRDPRLAAGQNAYQSRSAAYRGRQAPQQPYDPYRSAAASRYAARQQPPVDEDDPIEPGAMPQPAPPQGGPGFPVYDPSLGPQFGPPYGMPYGPPYGPPLPGPPPEKCDPEHLYLGNPDPRCVDPRPVPPVERDWFTRVEFVYWKMPRPAPYSISVDTATNANALNTDNLEFDFRGGPRLTIGRFVDVDDSIDFRYTSLFREASVEAASSGGTLQSFPTNAGGYSTATFQNATAQRISYGTEFHDMRLIYTKYFKPTRNVLFQAQGGFRYFILNQQFTFDSQSSSGLGRYQVFTHNHVFGPEFGGTVLYPIGDATYITASGGGGLTLNIASLGADVWQNGGAIYHQDSHEWTPGILGNLELGLRQNFGPRAEARIGYELMFVGGVATAPGQVDLVNTTSSSRLIDSQQQLFLHGITVGGTLRW